MSIKFKVNKHEPTTSYGIINLYLSNELSIYKSSIKHAFNTNLHVEIPSITIDDNNNEYNKIYKMVKDNLIFLLVSRKNSLGYIEFIRGRYDISDTNTIEHLFKQMTETEICNIFTLSFDTLWCTMWRKNSRKNMYNKEYVTANENYTFVIDQYNINTFKPEHPIKEWGFPKGRKNSNETNMTCAIRECCEETSLVKTEINILTGIAPLVEEMTGTNDVIYKHVYYLSIIDNIRNLTINDDIAHFAEIDIVGWFKKDRTDNLIRPYHTKKLDIINQVITFITYAIYCSRN
jgi:8-oxo-dGTP pyrophosphatase MutT (NUDIX family)